MATKTLALDLDLELITCCNCGISFGIPTTIVRERRRDHETFYCPNGHSQYFPGQSDIERAKAEAEKLRGELAAAKQSSKYAWNRVTEEREKKEAARRSAAAHKGAHTRTKRRVAAGVCPCCNRTFANLARHMAGQHPDFAPALQGNA